MDTALFLLVFSNNNLIQQVAVALRTHCVYVVGLAQLTYLAHEQGHTYHGNMHDPTLSVCAVQSEIRGYRWVGSPEEFITNLVSNPCLKNVP
jgi:hypothetical protein